MEKQWQCLFASLNERGILLDPPKINFERSPFLRTTLTYSSEILHDKEKDGIIVTEIRAIPTPLWFENPKFLACGIGTYLSTDHGTTNKSEPGQVRHDHDQGHGWDNALPR